MSAQDRAIQKLARELAGIKKEVVSWRGPQADYTSIENGGNFTFKDGDGNVTAVVGGQDDGSNTIRHVDGPVPAVPSGLSAHVDGPIVQAAWDGTFETDTTYDWAYLEVEATGPSGELVRSTITDTTGGSVAFTATVSGVWTIVARSVSRAEKRSLDGDAGTVEVELVGISGAIEAVQDSANGKNKVTYSEYPPTPADPGIFDDTWFVGQVGRPNDLVEATNLVANPSMELSVADYGGSSATTHTASTDTAGIVSGSKSLKSVISGASAAQGLVTYTNIPVSSMREGMWVAFSVWVTRGTGPTHCVPWLDLRDGSGTFARTDISHEALGASPKQIVRVVQVPAGSFDSAVATLRYHSSAGYSVPQNGTAYTDAWHIAVGASEAEVRAKVATYFDGDTPSGTTDNESHYRWTGTPHASTSEKYLPALSIGDSDNWNVIEQYRHDGTGWVRVELSHKVFSSVDLGKATVGELDGIRIAAQTIRGQQLSGDAIDGKVITGGTYRTTGGTGSWSDDGLFIAQPDGTSMVRFPTDGSPLSLTASDVQIDRASITDLDLSYGAVRSGGQVTLASGVTAPASPPELTTGWQKVCSLEPVEWGRHDWVGLAYWEDSAGGKFWVRAVNYLGTGENDSIELYDHDTGAYVRRIIIDCDPRNGLTVMGDIVYVFGGDHGAGNAPVIDGYSLVTGARTSRHFYTRSIQAQNALGNDGTNLIVASVYNRRLWVHYRNPVTGVQVGSDMLSGELTWPAADASNLYGVSINAAGTEITVIPTVAARVYTISGGTLTHKPDPANANGLAGWENPNRNGAGMAWRAGAYGTQVPFVVDGTGSVYEGFIFPSDATIQACFTWFNGTNETTPSPIAVITNPARNSTTFSTPSRDGMQKRVYVKTNTGPWQVTTLAAEQTALTLLDSALGAATSLPTTNTFPNADPATLKSTNNKFEVHGDGSGTWGPLTFNADGTMTSTQIPAWVPVTTFKTGFGPQAWGHAPAYRIWPDGKVEWRGIVAGTIGDGQTPIFTIPSAARPAQSCQFGTAASYNSTYGSVARIEFGTESNLADASAYDGPATRSWISLDGVYYYKD